MEKSYVSLLVELFHMAVHDAHFTEEQLIENHENWAEKEAKILAILRRPAKHIVLGEDVLGEDHTHQPS